MNPPRHLLTAWPQLRRRLMRAPRRALFADFDGTLVRIRRRKHAARLPSQMRRLLAAAAAAGDVVGIVSGRLLESARAATRVDGIWYAGVHGYFLSAPNGRRFSFLNATERRRVSAATRGLQRRLAGVKGIVVEPKGAAVTVHYRRAGRRARERAWAAVQECLGTAMKKSPAGCQRYRLRLLRSKKAWELLPQHSRKMMDKWEAVRFILRRERFVRRGHGAVVYLGDDTTDECVFRALGGITVAVGKRRRTAARYYLNSPGEVRGFLEKWNRIER